MQMKGMYYSVSISMYQNGIEDGNAMFGIIGILHCTNINGLAYKLISNGTEEALRCVESVRVIRSSEERIFNVRLEDIFHFCKSISDLFYSTLDFCSA